jgi:disulfide bond formation protein DsbB
MEVVKPDNVNLQGEIMISLKRNISLIGFLLAFLLVLASYYVQHAFNFRPCLLCSIQRGVFIALGLVFFLALIHQYFRGTARSYSIITALLSLLGIVASGRQLWLQSLPLRPNEVCIPGVGYLFHELPFLDALKMIFTASQECGRVEWVFLHISMPGWALLFFILFLFVSILMGTHRR